MIDDDAIVEMLFNIRQFILDGDLQGICKVYNEMSGESIQCGTIESELSRSELIQKKLQEKLQLVNIDVISEKVEASDDGELDESLYIDEEFKMPEVAEKGKSKRRRKPSGPRATERLDIKNNPDGDLRYHDQPPVKPNWD